MPNLEAFAQSALMTGSPLAMAALGGFLSDRAGVVHVGLEGLMVAGAFTGAAVQHGLEGALPGMSPWIATAVAAAAGALLSLPFAWMLARKRADQVVAGMALNFTAVGVTLYLCRLIFGSDHTPPFRIGMLPGPGGLYPSLYLALSFGALIYFLMYKTAFGLRLRACGTNPEASRTAGIDPGAIRWRALALSGCMAGMAGSALVLTSGIQFGAGTVNGMGFLALAACSFGSGGFLRLLSAVAGFSLVSAVGILLAGNGFLPSASPDFYSMLPYLAAVSATAMAIAFRRKNRLAT